jgi:hypothetical protein
LSNRSKAQCQPIHCFSMSNQKRLPPRGGGG